jgi:hemoglobin
MEKAHAGLNLQPEHFDAIVKHLSEALEVHHVPSDEINIILEHIANLKEAVLYK